MCEESLLRHVAMLEELLNHVVAKDVMHQLQSRTVQFMKDTLLVVTVGILQLGLDETRPVLIAGEFHDVPMDILQLVPSGMLVIRLHVLLEFK